MRGGFLAVCCLDRRMGLGRLGGLPLRKAGRPTVVHWCAGWLACLVIGVGNTPAAACWVVVGAPACVGVWGWHAVGVLGQCALVA